MTQQLIAALITLAILAVLFPNTRTVGILCVAALTFLFPIPRLIVVLLGAGHINPARNGEVFVLIFKMSVGYIKSNLEL